MSNKQKKSPVFDMEAEVAQDVDMYGGLIAVEALTREFGLWEKVRAIESLDLRKKKTHGFSPELIVAQLVFSLCSGGAGLSDAEELFRGAHPALNKLLGVTRGADASTLGEWLRGQNEAGIRALQELIREFVGWVMERADPASVRRGESVEVFFDDTQIEVSGKYFEGAEINYKGEKALSWQTCWVGPFIAAGSLGKGNRDVSALLPEMLEDTRELWEAAAKDSKAHFYADSGSSASKYLAEVDAHPWGWSVSYNKWTDKLDTMAKKLPEDRWTDIREGTGRNGEEILERFGWLRHMPGDGEELDHAVDFAVVAWRGKEELAMWHYSYVAGRGGATACAHDPEQAAALFARHKCKGNCERGFSELLSDLDLHHPPCQSLVANQMFYTLGMLAHNLLRAMAVLWLGKEEQRMRVRSLVRRVISVPMKISSHARRTKVRLFCPANWHRWWQEFFKEHFPRRSRGRPRKRPPL